MTDARELTLALGGRWHGRYGTAPCPACQPERKRGQDALTLADGTSGRLMLHCKKSAYGFLDILAAAGLRSGDYRAPDPATLAQREATQRAEAVRRAAQAKWLWHESLPIAGTPAKTYLRGRGIACPLPAMLAARLALVLGFLDWAADGAEQPHEITHEHFGRAAHLVEAYFLPMA